MKNRYKQSLSYQYQKKEILDAMNRASRGNLQTRHVENEKFVDSLLSLNYQQFIDNVACIRNIGFHGLQGLRDVPDIRVIQMLETMANDPAGHLDSLIEKYKPLPGYEFKKERELQNERNAAAAGGYAGSNEHRQAEIVGALITEDMQNYLSNILSNQVMGIRGLVNNMLRLRY